MNKKFLILLTNFLLINIAILAQEFRVVENNAFQAGEKLRYKVYYKAFLFGNLKAGHGTLTVKNSKKTFYNRNAYHIKVEAKSKGFFNVFHKINDTFESYVDKESLFSWNFIRDISEGNYKRYENIKFNAFENLAYNEKKKIPIPDNIQDIISLIYYTRTLDFSDKKIGDTFPINFFIDDSVYVSVIKYIGKEVIRTKFGKINCLKIKPMVVKGKIFDNPYPMTLWITDDNNHIPLLVKTGIKVGSVTLKLKRFSGLKNKNKALIGK